MEGGAAAAVSAENAPKSASYTYWVRQATRDAAPLPVPKKIDPTDLCNQPNQTHLGSAWNRAGTWEEKNLNKWASDRIKELLSSMRSLEFSSGKAEIAEVTRCSGDINYNKRIGVVIFEEGMVYWREKKNVKGHIDVPEFSFGELDDLQASMNSIVVRLLGFILQIQVKLIEDKDIPQEERQRISQDLRLFWQPLQEKLLQFEEELKAQ
ncbi:hypothetical protein Sango_2833700 [Sesamum angolense]|uniref:Activator of Hsp90 ATPase AHSA1-like N-terminal domain-containing protein n=1 Tax=Sesamum angolense TaxID=2727404 RepID=A0AAE1T7C4_9LAMI|nr:hypothetical protein Sango_2833700 [Sesamum angolense]